MKDFYDQGRGLLRGLGVDSEEVNRWTEAAIFHQRGWRRDADNPSQRLLLEGRRRVAFRFGGALPGDTGIEGVPTQGRSATLTRWLKGEEIQFGKGLTSPSFYNQIRAFFTHENYMTHEEVDRLIAEIQTEGET